MARYSDLQIHDPLISVVMTVFAWIGVISSWRFDGVYIGVRVHRIACDSQLGDN